jgi:hypothetical protein
MTTSIINILLSSKSFSDLSLNYNQVKCSILILNYTNVSLAKNNLCFDVLVQWTDLKSDEKGTATHEIIIKVGHKTASGYLSSKKIGVNIKDLKNLTQDEVFEVLTFQTNAIDQKFDPFFAQNQIERKNASAWSSIASKYMQPDCR